MTKNIHKEAKLYRMVMDQHLCPYGLKSKDLLQREGYQVQDHHLSDRAEVERFKQKHSVSTTPQAFIEGERIGGYEDLRRYFGKSVADDAKTSYQPVIALFGIAALMALGLAWNSATDFISIRTLEWFVAISMCLLAMLKLRDVEQFSTMFLGYDLLARKIPRYAYFYPFAEGLAGVLMLAGALIWLAAPLALLIGAVGAMSVFKAVYLDKRELKCACVGGDSNVPLGFISLTENLMMIAMGLWMLISRF